MTNISARGLERILIASMVGLIALAIGGFYLLNGILRDSAKQTNHAQINADIGRETISQLRTLDAYIKNNQSTIDRAASIVADSKQYSYQDQIVADINTYATRAGVSVLGYNFQTEQQKGSRVVAGLKTITATVNLRSPVSFRSYLRFLRAIESNLTKMQITGVSLSPDTANPRDVSNPTVGLEVYVK